MIRVERSTGKVGNSWDAAQYSAATAMRILYAYLADRDAWILDQQDSSTIAFQRLRDDGRVSVAFCGEPFEMAILHDLVESVRAARKTGSEVLVMQTLLEGFGIADKGVLVRVSGHFLNPYHLLRFWARIDEGELGIGNLPGLRIQQNKQ